MNHHDVLFSLNFPITVVTILVCQCLSMFILIPLGLGHVVCVSALVKVPCKEKKNTYDIEVYTHMFYICLYFYRYLLYDMILKFMSY